MTDQVPLTTSPLPYRLTVEDFFRLDNAGTFEGYGKTELIRGEVFYLNAQHRPHARMKGSMFQALLRGLAEVGGGLDVLIEATVAMPPHSAPEPDLIVTAEPEGDGPVPVRSVSLLVEIADTTQAHDLTTKAALYAENGVPEYWVVDLKATTITQLWSPSAGKYSQRRDAALGELIEAMTIAGLAVQTDRTTA